MSLDNYRETILNYLFGVYSCEEMEFIERSMNKKRYLKKLFEAERKTFQIHKFAEGEMNIIQKRQMERRIMENEELANEVKIHYKIHDWIDDTNLHEILKEICFNNADMHEQEPEVIHDNEPKLIHMYTPKKKKHVVLHMKKWIAAASIAILILMGAGVTYKMQNRGSLENRLYTKYYEPIDNVNIYFLLNNDNLSKAKKEYAKKNYVKALTLLEDNTGLHSLSIERKFYLGLTLMEVNAYNEAIKEFENILKETDIKDIRQYINWYLGLCYLKSGKTYKAKEIFSLIVNKNGYNYKKAEKILNKINS